MTAVLKTSKSICTSDLTDEPVDRLLVPIRGYEKTSILPLTETIEPISGCFENLQDYVYVALHNCQHPLDGLDQQESAAIQLYTMKFIGQPSLYDVLNRRLRTENRDELTPWFPFLKLFLTALHKLPSQSGIIWRGIKNVDLSSQYKKGKKFVWWGVSSCTTDIEVLESEDFLGKTGERTIFSIECLNGKSTSNHSYFKDREKEIILMPGSYFEVIGQLNTPSQLHIIQLREIQPPITFITPPFTISPTSEPSCINQNIHTSLQIPIASIQSVTSKTKFPTLNMKWKQEAIIVAGGNGDGNQLNQLYCPEGIFIDDHQTIYIVDWGNDRIVEWKSDSTAGRIVAGGKGEGAEIDQFHCPTDVLIDKENNCLIIADYANRRVVRWSLENNTTNGQTIIENIDCWGLAMDKDGSLYISDWKKNEVRRWKNGEKNERIIAGGNGQGNELNQFNGPTYIFVDKNYSLYISDKENHRVMKWTKDAKEGVIVAGGNGKGNSLKHLFYPAGVIVDDLDQIYVSDDRNGRVMCWREGDGEGRIVVGGESEENQLSGPRGLSFDDEGNLYVADHQNDRILKFEVDLI